MKGKKTNITYSIDLDFLDIETDSKNSANVFISKPMKGVALKFNKNTGGLLEIMLSNLRDNMEDRRDEFYWDAEKDSILISLSKENNPNSLCDLVYVDDKLEMLVTLNRNEVGNLVGIEVIGVHEIMKKFKS